MADEGAQLFDELSPRPQLGFAVRAVQDALSSTAVFDKVFADMREIGVASQATVASMTEQFGFAGRLMSESPNTQQLLGPTIAAMMKTFAEPTFVGIARAAAERPLALPAPALDDDDQIEEVQEEVDELRAEVQSLRRQQSRSNKKVQELEARIAEAEATVRLVELRLAKCLPIAWTGEPPKYDMN